MTKEEIGLLFPIEILPSDEKWLELFENEKILLAETLSNKVALRIEHFGSTAIPGLAAKPTIDILMEIDSTEKQKAFMIEKMKTIRYDFIWRTDTPPPYMMFAKGYRADGKKEQTYHIHAAPKDHPLWDRLYFRDYLKQNHEVAKEYEQLKIKLATKHKYDREDYTNAKTEFVTRITELAKNLYSNPDDGRN